MVCVNRLIVRSALRLSALVALSVFASFLPTLAVESPAGASTITIPQFITNVQGTPQYNTNGTYLGECVSLISQYLHQVYNETYPTGLNTDAIDYQPGMPASLISRGWSYSTNSSYQNGDILVYGTSAGQWGHVAIYWNGNAFSEWNHYDGSGYVTGHVAPKFTSVKWFGTPIGHWQHGSSSGSYGGTPSLIVGNANGQMTVQLTNFPTGTGHFFCHSGLPSSYPTGGTVGPNTQFTISSPNQSWSSGFCSGSGNYWLGVQAPGGPSVYSNQVILGSGGTPSLIVGNANGQMTVQLTNFPTGTGHFFCHSGLPSSYPTGGTVGPNTQFTISSPNQSWSSGFCSGSGNYWLGVQAPGGPSVYSNQVILGSGGTPSTTPPTTPPTFTEIAGPKGSHLFASSNDASQVGTVGGGGSITISCKKIDTSTPLGAQPYMNYWYRLTSGQWTPAQNFWNETPNVTTFTNAPWYDPLVPTC